RPVDAGNEVQRSIAVLSCAPLVISRPSAFRRKMGSRVLRAGTRESMGTCVPYVHIGEMVNFHGISNTPKKTIRCRSSVGEYPFSSWRLLLRNFRLTASSAPLNGI